MSIELPLLHLGLAGFSVEEQEHLGRVLNDVTAGTWRLGKFADSDAWVLNGARVQLLADSTIRVASGVVGGRSLHLNLADVDRPVAFALPLAPHRFDPLCTFNPRSPRSVTALLETFEGWMRPMMAQFFLASRILEQESVLGPGIHRVTANGVLIAIVDMRGEIGVLPTATETDFENAMWHARPSSEAGQFPENFVRCNLALLMWQYAIRTSRDVLPARYRTGTIYFRRPPRLAQRLLTDAHLLLLRELAGSPDTFAGLQQRTGLGAVAMARDLAALYFVGAITGNPRRAAPLAPGRRSSECHSSVPGSQPSVIPSALDADAAVSRPGRMPAFSDLTAPAPIGPR
jgi:hypothetical protein